jgi:hypothetical protein
MGVGCENFLQGMNIKGFLLMYVGKFCLFIIFIGGGETNGTPPSMFFLKKNFVPKLVIIDKNM